jgi:hypothetical protein|tara:strand:+ start:7007 stop:7180 length:174 start_codon:yes stop_codon:yes gene_type:complete
MKRDILKRFLELVQSKNRLGELEESILRAKTLISLDIKLDSIEDDYFMNREHRRVKK